MQLLKHMGENGVVFDIGMASNGLKWLCLNPFLGVVVLFHPMSPWSPGMLTFLSSSEADTSFH